MSTLSEVPDLRQAIWLDTIRRALITSGELQALIDIVLRGVISNPTLFEEAIAGSSDYDEGLERPTAQGKSQGEMWKPSP